MSPTGSRDNGLDTERSPSTLDRFTLPGRVAIVTGAGSGIGEGIATVLASVGASVVCADIAVEAAERVARAISAGGAEAVGRHVDVSSPDSVESLVAATVAEFGTLDIMCNVAGILIDNELLDVSPEEFDTVLGVNLKGVLYGCQSAARVMRAGGNIVNIASAIIDRPAAGRGSYAASKGGVVQLTRSFALELGPRGIRVNGVAPGWVVSGITRRRFTDSDGRLNEELKRATVSRFAAASPLNTIVEPSDIGHAVLYLVSDAGRATTGQMLRTDAGMNMV